MNQIKDLRIIFFKKYEQQFSQISILSYGKKIVSKKWRCNGGNKYFIKKEKRKSRLVIERFRPWTPANNENPILKSQENPIRMIRKFAFNYYFVYLFTSTAP